MTLCSLLTLTVFTTLVLLITRLILILPGFSPLPRCPSPIHRGQPTRLLIVLGSGGHTAEMLSMIQSLDTYSYTHRSYVIGSGDEFSARKATEFEAGLEQRVRESKGVENGRGRGVNGNDGYGTYDISSVPRARNIHQSLLTSPLSCLRCLVACISVLRFHNTAPTTSESLPAYSKPPPSYPNIILTNGPATATILLITSLLLRFLALPGTGGKMRNIYVESWARVRRMSLSGKILVGVGACERVLVQWEGLGGWGREYRGALVG
ncbi:UDP-N-acetylglucosamine transferase subunit [Varicellaria rhodocarpa]|nr:UDP-N-acetylglucosamine transferase subunit [Varicellaria rhodocarpa]